MTERRRLTCIAHLAPRQGIEGRAVQQDIAFTRKLFHSPVVCIKECHHMGLAFEVVIAYETRGRQVRQHGQVSGQAQVVGLHGSPCSDALSVQLLLESGQVGGDAPFPAPVLHKVHGKAVGVVEPENV